MYKNFMEWNKPLQDLFYVVLYSLIQSRFQVFRIIFIKWLQVQALESRSVDIWGTQCFVSLLESLENKYA